jgi:hypothetical protein
MTATDGVDGAGEVTRARLRAALARPVDAASLRVYRTLFGVLMLVAVARFFANGWIASEFGEPRHFFHYWGLAWLRPLPGVGMHLLFGAMGAAAAALALGWRPRLAAGLFALLFTYAHLCDATNYLNHYYLISMVAVLLALLPVHGATAPAWALWALRAQIALVYLFGGIAKLGPDWLVRGEPLRTWLAAHGDFPLVGGLLVEPWVALAASWAGALFDLTVVGLLLWRRSRPFALLAVVGFHLVTARLFHLGLFPWVMIASSTLFFDPDWPRRLRLRRAAPPTTAPTPPAAPLPRWPVRLLAAHFALQLLLPFRSLLYPGNPLWHEQGFRFAWKVMLMEKSGVAEFHVRDPATGRTWIVQPTAYYTRYQATMMATQPDLILQAAHLVARDFRARGVAAPEVRAEVFASLNGRPRARLVDPTVDLARERDGLGAKRWILPLGQENP